MAKKAMEGLFVFVPNVFFLSSALQINSLMEMCLLQLAAGWHLSKRRSWSQDSLTAVLFCSALFCSVCCRCTLLLSLVADGRRSRPTTTPTTTRSTTRWRTTTAAVGWLVGCCVVLVVSVLLRGGVACSAELELNTRTPSQRLSDWRTTTSD